MKKLLIFSLSFLIIPFGKAQISFSKVDGGSVITKLGMGINVNDGSSLNREWVVLNDETCPLQLDQNLGINSGYFSSRYSFSAKGSVYSKEEIVAFEIHHVLYDVFGGHIKSLSNLEVADFSGEYKLDRRGSWYATENQISEYLICVSYVANVRTKSGSIWRYNPDEIKQKLSEIQISYEEGYSPANSDDDK